MGIVMAMSVPIVYKLWRKAPMRQAVKDIVEVCSHARARAIMQGQVTEVVFHPKQNRLELVGGGSAPRPANQPGGEVPLSAPAATGSGLSAQLDQQVIIETLDINMSGVEFNDADSARVRFYPNGISDEMRMILFDGRDRMGIELEITTGWPTSWLTRCGSGPGDEGRRSRSNRFQPPGGHDRQRHLLHGHLRDSGDGLRACCATRAACGGSSWMPAWWRRKSSTQCSNSSCGKGQSS